MRVLVGCEESQRVMSAFRALGHDAFSCDLKDPSGGFPEYHLKCDIFDVLYDDWDLVIAHPPCTYLTKAGAQLLLKDGKVINGERYNNGLAARDFFMRIYNSPCKRLCIENPTPLKIYDLPECSQVIQPYYFGDPYSKRTLLWLKNLPPLMATCIVPEFKSYTSTVGTAELRSKTFFGIATAMANQWSY